MCWTTLNNFTGPGLTVNVSHSVLIGLSIIQTEKKVKANKKYRQWNCYGHCPQVFFFTNIQLIINN